MQLPSNKLLAELVGTYCLVFAGTGAIVINDIYGSVSHLGIGLTFGLVVMAMIYSLGDLSGAHINPAVTIAFWVAKRFEGILVLPYIMSQMFGAILASLTIRFLFADHETLGSTLPIAGAWGQSFMLEFILTAILMFVILRVSSGSRETGMMAGTAIGATVALEAILAGPVSGASMNPARSLGPAIVSLNLDHVWIYIVATTLGACFAVVLDWLMRITPGETSGDSKKTNS
ncbi:MAG: MIP/aquaporin family protein [Mariniblastus sp.]